MKIQMNIELVPPDLSYVEKFYQWRKEKDSTRFNPLKELSHVEARELLRKTPTSLLPLADGETYRWFVKSGSEVVGIVSLTDVSLMMGTGQIGYTIGQDFHRQGIATEALRLWTQQIFKTSSLRKLTALVAEGNVGSLRVLEKNGYQREGFLREHFIIQNQPVNEILFALLRSEWKNQNQIGESHA